MPDELDFSIEQLFETLERGRTFHHTLGAGGRNILRTNSLDYLAPPSPIDGAMLDVFAEFAQSDYELPLSYGLIMQSLRSLQVERDPKLAIVHAATAVEVHVLHLLHGSLVILGKDAAEAWIILESDSRYEGISRRLKRLESHTKDRCLERDIAYRPFVGSALHERWRDILAHKRNRAVHAGVASFTWAEGAEAIGIAKETISVLDQRVIELRNSVQLNPSVDLLQKSAGGVLF